MRIDLVDRDGVPARVWIRDPARPELTDELGHPVLDMASHPFYPQPYGRSPDPVKMVLDAFMMSPSPGLCVYWAEEAGPGSDCWRVHAAPFAVAMLILTGKAVVRVGK